MEATDKLPVPVSARCSKPDWRTLSRTIATRREMKKIIRRCLKWLRSVPRSEAFRHVEAVENELFYQSNSLHDYIDNETLFDRIFVVSQRKFNVHIVSKLKNNGQHAEACNLIRAQFRSGSYLPQQGWAEHPDSARKYWQDASGVIVIDDPPPPLATNPAAYLTSPVDSSSGCAPFCYPPHLVTLVGSSNLNATFCNHSGSYLPQQGWAEHPDSARKYLQDASGVIVIDDPPPPLATNPAAYLTSPVDSSSGCAPFCYPPHLVTLVGSSNLNATFCNHSLPPDSGSVYGTRTPPLNGKQTPHGLLFNNNLAGGQYMQDIRGKNIVNFFDDPSTDQSGASARKYQQGRSNGVIIHETLPPLETYQTEYPLFPVGSSSGSTSNTPGPPYKIVANDGWTIPRNCKRGCDGPPYGNNSLGTPGGQYLQSIHGDNFLRQCDVPLNSPAVFGDEYLDSSFITPCGSSRLSNSPHLPIAGAVSCGGINLQEGKHALHGPAFGNYSSESAAILHQLNSNGQSEAAPGGQYIRGISSEHIARDHEAPLTAAVAVGIKTPASHADTSHGSSSAFHNSPRCPVIGTVNTGGVSLEGSKQAHNDLSSRKDSSQSEVTVLRQIHSAEQSGAPGRKYPQDLQNVIHNSRDCEPVMEDLPGLETSMGGTSDVLDLLMNHCADEWLSSMQQFFESQFPDVPVPNKSVVVDFEGDDESPPNAEVGPVHLQDILGFSTVDDSKACPSPEEPVICYELKVPAEVESMYVDEVALHDNLEVCSFSETTKIPSEDENTSVQPAQTDGSKTPEDEISETENINSKILKTEISDLSCVSVTESLSVEQILEHLSSLGSLIGKDSGATKSFSENICRTCGKNKIFFEPAPCTTCGTKIKKNRVYYSSLDEEDGLKLCRPCYDNSGKRIKHHEKAFDKENLHKRITKEGAGENWVQCDKCKGWQHQICTLYNQQRDKGGKGKYTCPLCCIKEIKSGDRLPSEVGLLNAKNLPRTSLSDHIEQRLLKRLREERQLRASGEGKGFFEVPGAEDLTVRVVLTEKKNLKVKKEFLDLFNPTDYPSEFPYTSKMVLVFQKIGVVDVILFCFYTQEYGSDCDDPNCRWIYISYLDSIKYFRPSIPTATGEALRTFAYHEILIGYLDYCKKRGFISCHIWSCAPRKGQDYLFYHHPENQRTPTGSKLTNWYQTMIQKAVEEKVVVSHSNMYDYHFRTSSGSRDQVSATSLPYFEGDSWFNFAEAVLKEVDEESKSNHKRKRAKTGPKHKPKAVRCADALYDSKDFLFMQKLGKILQQERKNFIVMHLRHVCSHCHQAIASGQGWFCNGCTDFQLCERCHEDENSVAESHRLNKGEEHFFSKVAVDRLPLSTDDEDGYIESHLLGNRHRFLKFCQDNHYQFDTLRRAKHSSMMVLHFLSCPDDLSNCSICAEASPTNECWTCKTCPDFLVCSLCHKRKCFSHSHPLTSASNS